MTTTVVLIDGTGTQHSFSAELTGSLLAMHSVPEVGGSPVSSGNPMPVTSTAGTPAPVAGAATKVVTGGAAVTAFTVGQVKLGAWITNPDTATAPLYVDGVNTPAVAAPGTNGTTTKLNPGQSMSFPAGWTIAVQVNSSDSNHAFTAVAY